MDRVRSRTGALQKKDLLAPEELAVYSFGLSPGRKVLHVLFYCGSSCTSHITRIVETRVNGHACEPSVLTSGKPV